MPTPISPEPLAAEAFAPFGQVIEKAGAESYLINNGACRRFHALAGVEVSGPSARAVISIFAGQARSLPLVVPMVERHPLGSQSFYPLSANPFLVVVCEDEDGRPVSPRAFLTAPGQGVNYGRNVWHGVLTPLGEDSDFLVVDRDGEGGNLEEFVFDEPFVVDNGTQTGAA